MSVPTRVALAVGAVGALAARADAELPADGVLAVVSHGSSIEILRVGPAGFTSVTTHKLKMYHAASDYGWSDVSTLWVIDTETGKPGGSLLRFDDGKLSATIALPPLDRTGRTDTALRFTTTGQVWIEHCDRRGDGLLDVRACPRGAEYYRVDGGSLVASAAAPKGVDVHRSAALAVEGTHVFPRTKPPRGHSAKVTNPGRANARATCKGPSGEVAWPTGRDPWDVPTRVTWLRASPPVVRVDLKPSKVFAKLPIYFFDCSEVVDAVHSFGSDVWGVYRHIVTERPGESPRFRSTQMWTVYDGVEVVGTVDGVSLRFAPIP